MEAGTKLRAFLRWLAPTAAIALGFGIVALQAWWGWRETRLQRRLGDEQFPPQVQWTQPADMSTYTDYDGNYWFHYAREMLREGRWHIRHTSLDNTPYGREVHWSSSWSWWMILLAKSRAVISGGTALDHLAWAADWSEAVMQALFIVVFVLIFRRKVGAFRLAAGAAIFAGLECFAGDFNFARPDHHGLHDGLALCGFACMARAFWPEEKSRRLWMSAAAFFGAAGMWVGATGQFFVLGTMALGGTVWALLRHEGNRAAFAPLWRLWGWAGAGFALFFYVLEYAPGPWPFRLEVNHPLYALAWAGLGEFVACFQKARAKGKWFTPGLLLAGVAVIQLPTVILSLPAGMYAPRDPHIISLLKLGVETTPVMQTSRALIAAFFCMVAIVAAAALDARASQKARAQTAALMVPLTAALLLLCFAAMQVRWSGFAGAAVLVVAMAPAPRWRWQWLRPAAAATACASAVYSMSFLRESASRLAYSVSEGDWQAVRDLGLFLRDTEKDRPLRLMTDFANPVYPLLHDFAGAQLVSAPYWECAAGLKDSNTFWLATDEAVAREICERRGVTHVIIKGQPSSVMTLVSMPGETPKAEQVSRTMAYRLGGRTPRPPAWLEPVPLPVTFALASVTVTRLYRVRD